MTRAFAAIAFTPEVRALQEQDGSAAGYARFLAPETPAADVLGFEERAFIAARDGFYQASVGSNGWPYAQFRGGPRGFLRVLDDRTLGYADLRGNRQHLSAGNLLHDGRISLFLMDYPNRRRLKLWGEAEMGRPEEDPALAQTLTPKVGAKVQRIVKIHVRAFDWNCPQHIPQRFTVEEMQGELEPLKRRLTTLSEENAELRAALAARA